MLLITHLVFFEEGGLLSVRHSVFMFPKNEKYFLVLYRLFKTSTRIFIKRLKSAVGALYKINTISLEDLVPSSTSRIFKSFS
jgi:hypothetical protein